MVLEVRSCRSRRRRFKYFEEQEEEEEEEEIMCHLKVEVGDL